MRSPDGTCNNIQHPEWGARHTPFTRLMPAAYEDGMIFFPFILFDFDIIVISVKVLGLGCMQTSSTLKSAKKVQKFRENMGYFYSNFKIG